MASGGTQRWKRDFEDWLEDVDHQLKRFWLWYVLSLRLCDVLLAHLPVISRIDKGAISETVGPVGFNRTFYLSEPAALLSMEYFRRRILMTPVIFCHIRLVDYLLSFILSFCPLSQDLVISFVGFVHFAQSTIRPWLTRVGIINCWPSEVFWSWNSDWKWHSFKWSKVRTRVRY